ncbi:ceramide glucosyltransferase [Entomortierella parvispora]|uniref:Ceramide glucosyltransferase n=1 Tax=Entomortierella parvispora TaxID=205924 RepID=A0A9P3H9C5_9FUNG|nr:ceramide glucosyltransferase [Entomortierella parvispora]
MDRLQDHFRSTLTSAVDGPLSTPQPLGSVWERHSKVQLFCMVLSIFFWVFSFTAAFTAITISRWRYAGHKRSLSSRMTKEQVPGVTIIRPLRGIDCNMYENLASSFRQDYPLFEIVFSVAQANDPAIAVVRDLMKKFPKVDARLIIGEKNVGINPKINNMIQSYETAKYDTVWVCDSNVYVDPGCMGRSMDKMMKPGVGLVHHLPFGVRPQTLGSELELMFLDTVHAKMYLFINWTGLASCVVGKSNLYRRSDLDKVGGMAAFGKYMAEDNLVATAIFNMGYKHEMTSDLAYQSLGSMSPSDYFLRRARWTRIRKYTVTAATVVEPYIEMIGCGLVASYGFNLLWQIHALNFLAFHVVIWFLVDLSMYQALSGEKMDNLQGFLMAWCLRELAALPLYAYAVVGSTVDWRDQTFRLLRDGTVKAINPAPVAVKGPKITVSSSFASTSSPTSSVPSSPTEAAFWTSKNLANTMVPESTQASLRKFFRHPAVISIVRSTFAVIHFVVDILIKSQRNGNQEEDEIEHHMEGHQSEASGSSGKLDDVLKLQRVPLKHRSSSGSINSKSGKTRYTVLTDYDGDDSSATESDVALRRHARLRPSVNSSTNSSIGLNAQTKLHRYAMEESEDEESQVYSTTKTETEAEHGRRSTEEDELSKAVEPYLSDSLSRRGGRKTSHLHHRRELLQSSSQFLSVNAA